jgi:copper chaperone
VTRKTLSVQGMSCQHCKMAVTRAVSSIPGVTGVQVSLEANSVTFDYAEGGVPLESVKQAIEMQGYKVVS